MLVDNTVVHLPSAPVHRSSGGDCPGGSAVAVLAESLRPVYDPGRTGACRGIDSDRPRQRADRPPPDHVEVAARIRVGIARERASHSQDSFTRTGSGDPRAANPRGDYISAAEIRHLRERLEARLARDPGILNLRSIDVMT